MFFQLPKAAAGYDLSLFFRGAAELLRELALDAGSLVVRDVGGTNRPVAMSAGRSFHSVSGLWF
jgi:hypothetical protein